MKKIVKLISLLLVFVMMVGCFAACNQVPDNTEPPKGTTTTPQQTPPPTTTVPPTTAPKDYKDAKFMVAWWGADARHNATMEALKVFDKQFTNLETKVQYAGWGDYWTMLDTAIAGNQTPDVFQMDVSKVKAYVDAGKILKLDDYITNGNIDMSNVADLDKKLGYVNDGIYGVASGFGAPVYVYSTADLKAAGVTLSKAPTLDEVLDAAKKVYDKTGKKIIIEFNEYIRMCGESYYNEDGTDIGFSAETLANWWKLENEAMEYGYFVSPKDGIEGGSSGFVEGTVWCCTTYANQYQGFGEKSNLEVDWFAVPHTDKNKATSFTQPNLVWCVSADCENPELAIALLDFFVNSKDYYDLNGIDRGIPISSAIREYMEPKLTDAQKAQFAVINYLVENGLCDERPSTSAHESEVAQC